VGSRPDYDVIVVGAGHNALICAAYLARAGHRVGVFERRDIVGGAVSTAELVPGYQFDLGGSAHTLIRMTPVVEELELAQFGLEYIELDPLFYAPFPDGDEITIWRDVDRTVAGLEARWPGEGLAYRRFLQDWQGFALQVRDAFLAAPGPLSLGRRFASGTGAELPWRDALRRIAQPYGDVARTYFREPKLRAALTWMAAQSGPPPTEPLSAPFLLWHPLYHVGGIARPRGGSGMLTVALARAIGHHGGTVHVGTPVEAITLEGGRARGIVAGGRSWSARAVVSGTHALETFDRLLPPEARPPERHELRVGNGFGAMLRLALREPVRYLGPGGDAGRRALQLLCPSEAALNAAYGDYLRGEPAREPPLVAMTFSAVDPSLAPPGGEVLWLWAQYMPYELRAELGGAAGWDGEVGASVEARILATFEAYAPGTQANVVGKLFQHPLWLERELGLRRGNVMHLEMSLDQMFGMRPYTAVSGYRAEVPGLYLTGASTHPGGGIMGASGRNTAHVLLHDLRWGRT
jgi:phytoene dehydrogenase-like protein